jgi:hypothetical protein
MPVMRKQACTGLACRVRSKTGAEHYEVMFKPLEPVTVQAPASDAVCATYGFTPYLGTQLYNVLASADSLAAAMQKSVELGMPNVQGTGSGGVVSFIDNGKEYFQVRQSPYPVADGATPTMISWVKECVTQRPVRQAPPLTMKPPVQQQISIVPPVRDKVPPPTQEPSPPPPKPEAKGDTPQDTAARLDGKEPSDKPAGVLAGIKDLLKEEDETENTSSSSQSVSIAAVVGIAAVAIGVAYALSRRRR